MLTQEDYEIIQECGVDNVHGVEYGDIYYLNYYGINVFFKVCKTEPKRVCVFELQKRRVHVEGQEDVKEALGLNLWAAKDPLIVTKNNSEAKSKFWVNSDKDKVIWFFIDNTYPIYELAYDLGLNPEFGFFGAESCASFQNNGICRYYWDMPVDARKRKKKKNQVDKNSKKSKKNVDIIYC